MGQREQMKMEQGNMRCEVGLSSLRLHLREVSAVCCVMREGKLQDAAFVGITASRLSDSSSSRVSDGVAISDSF